MEIENAKNSKNTSKALQAGGSEKVESIKQYIESKGLEAERRVEAEVTLALDNYQVAMKKLRKRMFREFGELKASIKKSRKESNASCQGEIRTLKESLNNESGKKIKEIQFQVSTNKDFPFKTRHYIVKTSNIRVDTSPNYNLFNLCAFKESSKGMDDTMRKNLTRPMTKINAENEIKDVDQHKVNFLCQFLAKKVSPSSTTMVILAKLIKKPPTSLTKFWLRITKKPVSKTPAKLYAYKNAQYFCTLCRKYVCNLHYEETVDDPFVPANTDPDFEYSPYVTRYLVAYSKDYKEEENRERILTRKRKDDDEAIEDKYHTLYKCPSKISDDCYLSKSNFQNMFQNFDIDRFQEYEREYILNYCLKYGILNPCMIHLLMNTNKKCSEIAIFISKNSHVPKNVSPADLIAQARAYRINDSKTKKKRPEATGQGWKHYVPCYHPNQACGDKCNCRDSGCCEIFCGCPKDCPLRFSGCNCKPGKCTENNSCNCLKNNRECDPEICRNCSCEINFRLAKKRRLKTVYCPNTPILYKFKPRLLLGKSNICDSKGSYAGLGIFAGQTFERGDFIGEYVGEMIDYFEGDYRGIIYNDLGCSYMFDYEEDLTLDSFFYGNKLRFVNHGYGGMENSETKYKLVGGSVHIGLYTIKNIKVGDEILFNYGDNYQLEWLIEYNESVKKKKREEEKKKKSKKKKTEHIDLFQETKLLQEDMIFSDIEDS